MSIDQTVEDVFRPDRLDDLFCRSPELSFIQGLVSNLHHDSRYMLAHTMHIYSTLPQEKQKILLEAWHRVTKVYPFHFVFDKNSPMERATSNYYFSADGYFAMFGALVERLPASDPTRQFIENINDMDHNARTRTYKLDLDSVPAFNELYASNNHIVSIVGSLDYNMLLPFKDLFVGMGVEELRVFVPPIKDIPEENREQFIRACKNGARFYQEESTIACAIVRTVVLKEMQSPRLDILASLDDYLSDDFFISNKFRTDDHVTPLTKIAHKIYDVLQTLPEDRREGFKEVTKAVKLHGQFMDSASMVDAYLEFGPELAALWVGQSLSGMIGSLPRIIGSMQGYHLLDDQKQDYYLKFQKVLSQCEPKTLLQYVTNQTPSTLERVFVDLGTDSNEASLIKAHDPQCLPSFEVLTTNYGSLVASIALTLKNPSDIDSLDFEKFDESYNAARRRNKEKDFLNGVRENLVSGTCDEYFEAIDFTPDAFGGGTYERLACQ